MVEDLSRGKQNQTNDTAKMFTKKFSCLIRNVHDCHVQNGVDNL